MYKEALSQNKTTTKKKIEHKKLGGKTHKVSREGDEVDQNAL